MMIRWHATVLIALSMLTCTNAEARKPRYRQQRPAPQRAYQAGPAANALSPSPYYYPGPPWQRATDDYYRAAYPKYYGGFHVRELQSIGIPSNSGVRPYGFYMGW